MVRERVFAAGQGECDPLQIALPELDLRTGMTYCACDRAFLREMLRAFTQSDWAEKLEQDAAQADWAGCRIDAHALKSGAHMVGLTALSREAAELEEACKAGDATDAQSRVAQVAAHCRRVAEALEGVR